MKTYNPKTIDQLVRDPITKGDAFKGFPHTFDHALPQGWLDAFADWCKVVGNATNVTYHLILSTTVWSYPEGSCMGGPVTSCHEVQAAYQKWEAFTIAKEGATHDSDVGRSKSYQQGGC